MAQDLWPAHYQTFSVIFLKEFIKLKVNLDMMIKNVKHIDISININIINCDYFLEYTNFKDNLIEYKCLCCNKNYQHKFDEMTKNDFLIRPNFLTMITVSLFYYREKMCILMNTWMTGKISMKNHYLK